MLTSPKMNSVTAQKALASHLKMNGFHYKGFSSGQSQQTLINGSAFTPNANQCNDVE